MNTITKLRLNLAKLILPKNGYAFRGAAEHISTVINGDVTLAKPEAEKIIDEWCEAGIIR